MNKKLFNFLVCMLLIPTLSAQSWIRINQLGYLPESVKVAVFISTDEVTVKDFTVHNAINDKIIFKGKAQKYSGEDWGMRSAARLDFSKLENTGRILYPVWKYRIRTIQDRTGCLSGEPLISFLNT